MSKIGILTDCSSGLDYAPFPHNVKLTRMGIHFGEETFFDGLNITAINFMNGKTQMLCLHKCSNSGDITKCLKEFEEEGYTMFYFPLLLSYQRQLRTSS